MSFFKLRLGTSAAALAIVGLLAGCAPLRPESTTPAPVVTAPVQAPPPTAEPASEVPSRPESRVHRLFRRAFEDLEAGRTEAAQASLDSACTDLAGLLSEGADDLSLRQATDLVRVALELHHDVLGPAAPIRPESGLAVLLLALPDPVVSHLEDHPFYGEFWVRRLAGTANVPVDYTPDVVRSIRYFQTEGRRVLALWLARSTRYLSMIHEVFSEFDLPKDLAYKAMIESGFNPRAYSRARAAGLWQFMGHTARLYGLRRNTWIDERRDPEKSTRAAARHITHLHRLFPDWRLVIAAYNCGQGRLERAIRKSGTRDFWEIQGLPRETRNHVPRFMAALLISKDPEWFGFGDVVYDPPRAYDTVPVSDCVDLKVAAECAGTTHGVMRDLNPELRRGYTPPLRKAYALRVPPGSFHRFRDRYARVPDHRKVRMVDYQVRYGDTVSGIAQRLRVSSQAIMDANAIRSPRRLRAGQRLQIPIRPERYAQARDLAASTGTTAVDPEGRLRVTYRVRKGDTLWEIAQNEGVTPEQIREWNGISRPRHIQPGNRLVIFRPVGNAEPKTGALEKIASAGDLYTVKPGDTLWEIARTYRISVEDLKRWNGIRYASRLRAGKRIIVRPVEAAKVE
ncbi:MAG: LysM peptidoglycan-binding domain-containing protein [Candidatus Latescibacteria bacterium]|nr:LysM peptidoglycan-binding domain-containing protein [Candidatus Latescibacterota bacterium]